MVQVKSLRYYKQNHSMILNEKIEVDIKTGTVYWAWEYLGNREKDFPKYAFRFRDIILSANKDGTLDKIKDDTLTAKELRECIERLWNEFCS